MKGLSSYNFSILGQKGGKKWGVQLAALVHKSRLEVRGVLPGEQRSSFTVFSQKNPPPLRPPEATEDHEKSAFIPETFIWGEEGWR